MSQTDYYSTLEIISLDAYLDGITKSTKNEPFQFFLPLALTSSDTVEVSSELIELGKSYHLHD